VLQCVAVCRSVLQPSSVILNIVLHSANNAGLLVFVCSSVLQCVAVCRSVLECVAVCRSVLQPSSVILNIVLH